MSVCVAMFFIILGTLSLVMGDKIIIKDPRSRFGYFIRWWVESKYGGGGNPWILKWVFGILSILLGIFILNNP